MIDSLVNKYMNYILQVNPSKLWKSLRFVLHIVTIPVKLFLIGGLGYYQILHKKLTSKARTPGENKNVKFDSVLQSMPIWNSVDGTVQTYVCRSYVNRPIDGTNHNPDHQCARHSTFYFLMSKLGKTNEALAKGVYNHMQNKYLCRGYYINPYEGNMQYNVATTSGDMLCGLNLAVLAEKSSQTTICDRFDYLVAKIIENDYSLLEGAARTSKEDAGTELYIRLLHEAGQVPENVRMKSARGMWQPGLETVGAQALTVLATLRLADKKLGSLEARKHYRKLLWQYGYGLLSLFPTAYIDKQRGYFNDHNCMISLYVLSKLADTKLSKWFWKQSMKYVWSLSKHWYNAYFTGLLYDAHPDLYDVQYVDRCYAYLLEIDAGNILNKPDSYETIMLPNEQQPARLGVIPEDEFYPDIAHDKEYLAKPEAKWYRTGLGWVAGVVMLHEARNAYTKFVNSKR